MRLLDRYLLRELLVPLGYCLCFFLVFWVAFDLFSELGKFQENKMLIGDVVEYYIFRLPEFIVLVLPIAFLLSMLYALTNHARAHEITAIRAAGISLARLCMPYFAVGLLFSVGLFLFNEYWAYKTSEKADQIKVRRISRAGPEVSNEVQTNLGFPNGRDHRNWLIGSYNLKTRVMNSPQVNWSLPDGSRRFITAAKAEYEDGIWVFEDALEYEMAAGATDLVLTLKTNRLAMPEFEETPDQFRREIQFASRLSLRSAHSADIPIREILDYLSLHPDQSSRNKWWLYTKLYGRMAEPWTCLVVVLIAVPFGAASGRRNIFVGVAGSIVICFAYFILLRVGLALGTGGYVPAWLAAWMPNVCFGAAGAWMISRVR